MFAPKKILTQPVSTPVSDERLIQSFSAMLQKTNLLTNNKVAQRLEETISLGNILLEEKLGLKNHLELYHNFKNIFSTILPNLISSYNSLNTEYRMSALVRDNKTAYTILLEQLDNLKLILIEMKNTLSPTHLNNFLIESTLIEQKSINIENKEALLEQASIEARLGPKIEAQKMEEINKKMKEAQDIFVFFESFDEDNASQGKINFKIAVFFGLCLAAMLVVSAGIAILVV